MVVAVNDTCALWNEFIVTNCLALWVTVHGIFASTSVTIVELIEINLMF